MQRLDQDISTLTHCYSRIDQPADTDLGVVDAEPISSAILRLGAGIRAGIHMPNVQDYILQNIDDIDPQAINGEALTELFWFLFSQKAWEKIEWLADITHAHIPQLPAHVADLCFLAFYREQKDRLIQGKGRDAFHADAQRSLDRIARAWPDRTNRLSAFSAMVAHVLGEIDAARQTFSDMDADGFIEPFAGISSARMNVDGEAEPPASLQIFPSQCRHVTLLSLDEIYFRKFAELVARKYAQTNPANGLHFHCVGFDPSDWIALWDLPISIGITIDREDLTQLSARQQRGYFASARYLHLSRYLELYESVFVADVDGHVSRDIAQINDECLQSDVILSTMVLDEDRELIRLPWEAVTACAFMARSTTGGRIFARRLGAYLDTILKTARAQNRQTWYADQTALFYCWWDMRESVHFARFGKNAFIQKGSWKLFEGEQERLTFMSGY